MIQEVTDSIHVLHLRNTSVNSQEYLIQLNCQLKQDPHESVRMESLEERSNQVEYEQHLLLCLYKFYQFVSDQIQNSTQLNSNMLLFMKITFEDKPD